MAELIPTSSDLMTTHAVDHPCAGWRIWNAQESYTP